MKYLCAILLGVVFLLNFSASAETLEEKVNRLERQVQALRIDVDLHKKWHDEQEWARTHQDRCGDF